MSGRQRAGISGSPEDSSQPNQSREDVHREVLWGGERGVGGSRGTTASSPWHLAAVTDGVLRRVFLVHCRLSVVRLPVSKEYDHIQGPLPPRGSGLPPPSQGREEGDGQADHHQEPQVSASSLSASPVLGASPSDALFEFSMFPYF